MKTNHVACFCAACVCFALTLTGCRRPEVKGGVPPIVAPAPERPTNPNVPAVKFTDVTDKAGIKFKHENGAGGQKLLPESLGGGCAFLDFDNDGKQDLLLINSCCWPGFDLGYKPSPTLALYRNTGNGTFQDVTTATKLNVSMYGMGVAIGDFDNDGWTDIFVTGVGGNCLFRNAAGDKDGRKFVDVTKTAGDLTDSANWPDGKTGKAFLKLDTPISLPSSTAFLDYDRDGLLDLFVCNYITWSPNYDLTQGFTLAGIGRAYGPPTTFPGAHCTLYRNKGNGVFENMTRKAGIEVFDDFRKPAGKALGVVVSDVDEDGWPDIFVANDTVRNFFFHNQRIGAFREIGLDKGVAYAESNPRGAMGIDFGEYRPGQNALVIGNFANEPDTFLRLDQPKQMFFRDVAMVEGIAGPSRISLTFGLFLFDYDLDGRLDYLTNNGHLEPEINKVQKNQYYKQPVQLFWNTGTTPGFEIVTEEKSGKDLLEPLVGRGCAFADIDGNGTLDVVLMENGGPARLLKNEGRAGNNWVRFTLEGNGKNTNRSALGARVTLTAGKEVHKRELVASKGYLGSSELALTFGMGKAAKVDRVEIVWPGPDQTPQVYNDLGVNTTHSIKQK